ncbi:hypothetical protein [Argonema antarcticum]|uniref:hypothetical protein n=1 Tax=Argonema antarcticum TaxID=2942763 RepID=UPI0020123027|nr:hypothetical protein [Argonema antarcticum]MCL1475012.1 hypothetical protein [Argonema antarcticum A004/B2]
MKRKSFLNIFKIISEPARSPVIYFLLYFFIVTPFLGLFINGLSTVIFEAGCTLLAENFGFTKVFWQFWVAVAFAGLLVFLLMISQVPQLIREVRDRVFNQPPQINTNELRETFPGLIVLASPTPKNGTRPTPAEVVIRHHLQNGKLQHCWIICTDQSLPEAQNIIDKLVKEKKCKSQIFHYPELVTQNLLVKEEVLDLLVPNDRADDPNYICELVDAIYGEAKALYNMDNSQIITDYTGATKSMTAGVILACTHPDRRLQYISQNTDKLIEVEISYNLKPLKNHRRLQLGAKSQKR